MLKIAGVLAAPIVLPLIITDPLTTATTTADVARARCPCRGRIVGCAPIYGVTRGTTPFTDLDLMIEKGTTDIFSVVHPVINGSVVGTTEPDVLDAQREVADGDILALDAITIGGSSPVLVGFGYAVVIQPME